MELCSKKRNAMISLMENFAITVIALLSRMTILLINLQGGSDEKGDTF